MGRIIEQMNYNYYNQKESDLPKILLGIYKASVSNGSYPQMKEVFKREVPSSQCFNNPDEYKDIDNFINFCNSMDKAIVNSNSVSMEENDISLEETHSRRM